MHYIASDTLRKGAYFDVLHGDDGVKEGHQSSTRLSFLERAESFAIFSIAMHWDGQHDVVHNTVFYSMLRAYFYM